jgi:osmoprotectant transport system ATP-binding protein
MIDIQGVSKSFEGQVVINHFDLTIERGEIHVLLGASGSGKTTLLRMIGGVTEPDSGEIILQGKNINLLETRERTTRMAYITQEGGLFPHLCAEDNILLPAKVRRLDKLQIQKKLSKLAMMVDLDLSFLEKFPHELSGGQRQRVSLMRGLILDPEIVLLDEPLSALDPIVRASLQRELRDIFKKLDKTVVMVTHDIQEAAFLGDRITLLNEGRVVQTSNFKELYHNPKDPFVHEFLRAQIPMEISL